MNLIVENQVVPGVYRHLDRVCDLCREPFEPNKLVSVYICKQETSNPSIAKQQLVACRPCMGKLARNIQQYLGNLIVGVDQSEVTEL